MAKTKLVKVRLNEAELSELRRLAVEAGLTLSAYVRWKALCKGRGYGQNPKYA